VLLLGELVAEAEAVVEEAEAQHYGALLRAGLAERDGQLAVVVADAPLLAPHRLPRLVLRRLLRLRHGEAFGERRLVFQLDAETAAADDGLAGEREFVGRLAVRGQREGERKFPAGRADGLRGGAQAQDEQKEKTGQRPPRNSLKILRALLCALAPLREILCLG
jgi:hypothetical protein